MRVNKNYVLKEVDRHYYLLDGSDEKAFPLQVNETGAFLWEKLQGGAGEQELLAELLAEYSVEETVAKSDIGEYLIRLLRIGALEE